MEIIYFLAGAFVTYLAMTLGSETEPEVSIATPELYGGVTPGNPVASIGVTYLGEEDNDLNQ